MARTKSRTAVKNLRIGGRRIPYNVWKAVAAELLEGPEPTRNEIKNGALSKASTLFELCQTDAEWRKKAKACASRLMSAEARKYAAERGWADEAGRVLDDTGKDADRTDRDMWELYRTTVLFDLEHYGQPQPGMPTMWQTMDEPVDLITAEERDYALSMFVSKAAPYNVPFKLLAPKAYVPSCIDWAAIRREVAAA